MDGNRGPATTCDRTDHKLPVDQRKTRARIAVWHTYFIGLAEHAAGRSTCLRRQSGAVIVRDRMVAATGYRDTSTAVRNCGDGGCLGRQAGGADGICHCICAEQNALVQAAYYGIAVRGGTLPHAPSRA